MFLINVFNGILQNTIIKGPAIFRLVLNQLYYSVCYRLYPNSSGSQVVSGAHRLMASSTIILQIT